MNNTYPDDMPDQFLNELRSWKEIYKSPYSNSYYSLPDKDWNYTPLNCLRIADHWNFLSDGEYHCITNIEVANDTWSLAKFNGKWKILVSIPKKRIFSMDIPEEYKELIQSWNIPIELNNLRGRTVFMKDNLRVIKIDDTWILEHYNTLTKKWSAK